MRRGTPEVFVAILIALLLGSYVWYTQRVVADLRHEAERSSVMYARIWRALPDTTPDASTRALFDLTKTVTQQGVPIIITDRNGRVAAQANLPFQARNDDPRVAAYVATLDRQNEPVEDPLVGSIHYGNTRLVQGLKIIPALQTITAFV